MKKIETRLRVLEMATEIAAEAAQNTNVIWMIEFQEELIERLYKKMIVLVEDDGGKDSSAKDASAEDGKERANDRVVDEEHS
jgi:hypothetical protein